MEAIDQYYTHHCANVGRGVYDLSAESTKLFAEARHQIAAFFGATSDELILTRNATEAVNAVVWGWAQQNTHDQDVILVTQLEHHSNLVPWQNGKLQLIGNYISNMLTPQGQRSAQYFVDLGFQQKILNSKARLGLTVVDVFNTLKSGVENFTTEFSNYRNFKADTRAVMLTLAYSFRSTLKEKLLENKFSKE